MSTIFNSLALAQQALQTQQFGLEIAQRNIANVNTPGYSRQRVTLMPGDPNGTDGALGLAGVNSGTIESFRNRFLNYRVSQETGAQGYYDSVATALRQVEALVTSGASQGLDQKVAEFFNSFSTLANAPEDVTLRAQVLSSASDLGVAFKRLYDQLQSVRGYQEYFIADTTTEINSMTSAIAGLNARVAQALSLRSGDASELEDQRQVLLERLSGLMDVSYFETESGRVTVQTRQGGGTLVLGDDSYALEATRSSADGLLQIELGGTNITSTISSGNLGGLLKVRASLGGYMSSLDEMAAGLVARVNSQHRAGVDLDGVAGGDFFTPLVQPAPGSNAGAARSIDLAISDPKDIAAGMMGSGPGSNANARLLAAIRNEGLFASGTVTATEFYTNLVFNIGQDMRAAEDGVTLQASLLDQLKNQRDAYAGVNLDEEAISIVRYQKAFEATARYISVLDGLTEDLIRILG